MARADWERGLSRATGWLPGAVRVRLRRWYDAILPAPAPGVDLPLEASAASPAAQQRDSDAGAAPDAAQATHPMFDYWSSTLLGPELAHYGFSDPDQFYLHFLAAAARRSAGRTPRFISIGGKDFAFALRIAARLREQGLGDFRLECLVPDRKRLDHVARQARATGLGALLVPVRGDLDAWRPDGHYDAVLADQSLDHAPSLARLCAAVDAAIGDTGRFIVAARIGRHGQRLGPEARALVDAYWREVPARDSRQRAPLPVAPLGTGRDDPHAGVEEDRAADVLPVLRRRFGFEFCFAYANLIEPFIDERIGALLDPAREPDRRLIARIHARDEAEMRAGTLRPTRLLAVLCRDPGAATVHRPFLSPADCERPGGTSALAPGATTWICPACHARSRVDPIGALAPTQPGDFHTRDFRLVHCRRCDTVRLDPAPTDADLRAMYADAIQFSDDTYTGEARVTAMLDYYGLCLEQLELMPPAEGACLEVGAGRAWVSRAIKSRNAQVLTVAQDVSAECAAECPWVDRYHVGAVDALDRERRYDLVSLTHVIEHLVDPLAMLRELVERLAPGGRVFVTAPFRPAAWRPGDGIGPWLGYSYLHVPAHVSYLSRAWFDLAAEQLGLALEHWDAGHEDGQAFAAVLRHVVRAD